MTLSGQTQWVRHSSTHQHLANPNLTPISEYILNHAEIPIVFATAVKLPPLLTLAPKLKSLRTIVSIDPLSPETKTVLTAWAMQHGVELVDLSECRCCITWVCIDDLAQLARRSRGLRSRQSRRSYSMHWRHRDDHLLYEWHDQCSKGRRFNSAEPRVRCIK